MGEDKGWEEEKESEDRKIKIRREVQEEKKGGEGSREFYTCRVLLVGTRAISLIIRGGEITTGKMKGVGIFLLVVFDLFLFLSALNLNVKDYGCFKNSQLKIQSTASFKQREYILVRPYKYLKNTPYNVIYLISDEAKCSELLSLIHTLTTPSIIVSFQKGLQPWEKEIKSAKDYTETREYALMDTLTTAIHEKNRHFPRSIRETFLIGISQTAPVAESLYCLFSHRIAVLITIDGASTPSFLSHDQCSPDTPTPTDPSNDSPHAKKRIIRISRKANASESLQQWKEFLQHSTEAVYTDAPVIVHNDDDKYLLSTLYGPKVRLPHLYNDVVVPVEKSYEKSVYNGLNGSLYDLSYDCLTINMEAFSEEIGNVTGKRKDQIRSYLANRCQSNEESGLFEENDISLIDNQEENSSEKGGLNSIYRQSLLGKGTDKGIGSLIRIKNSLNGSLSSISGSVKSFAHVEEKRGTLNEELERSERLFGGNSNSRSGFIRGKNDIRSEVLAMRPSIRDNMKEKEEVKSVQGHVNRLIEQIIAEQYRHIPYRGNSKYIIHRKDLVSYLLNHFPTSEQEEAVLPQGESPLVVDNAAEKLSIKEGTLVSRTSLAEMSFNEVGVTEIHFDENVARRLTESPVKKGKSNINAITVSSDSPRKEMRQSEGVPSQEFFHKTNVRKDRTEDNRSPNTTQTSRKKPIFIADEDEASYSYSSNLIPTTTDYRYFSSEKSSPKQPSAHRSWQKRDGDSSHGHNRTRRAEEGSPEARPEPLYQPKKSSDKKQAMSEMYLPSIKKSPSTIKKGERSERSPKIFVSPKKLHQSPKKLIVQNSLPRIFRGEERRLKNRLSTSAKQKKARGSEGVSEARFYRVRNEMNTSFGKEKGRLSVVNELSDEYQGTEESAQLKSSLVLYCSLEFNCDHKDLYDSSHSESDALRGKKSKLGLTSPGSISSKANIERRGENTRNSAEEKAFTQYMKPHPPHTYKAVQESEAFNQSSNQEETSLSHRYETSSLRRSNSEIFEKDGMHIPKRPTRKYRLYENPFIDPILKRQAEPSQSSVDANKSSVLLPEIKASLSPSQKLPQPPVEGKSTMNLPSLNPPTYNGRRHRIREAFQDSEETIDKGSQVFRAVLQATYSSPSERNSDKVKRMQMHHNIVEHAQKLRRSKPHQEKQTTVTTSLPSITLKTTYSNPVHSPVVSPYLSPSSSRNSSSQRLPPLSKAKEEGKVSSSKEKTLIFSTNSDHKSSFELSIVKRYLKGTESENVATPQEGKSADLPTQENQRRSERVVHHARAASRRYENREEEKEHTMSHPSDASFSQENQPNDSSHERIISTFVRPEPNENGINNISSEYPRLEDRDEHHGSTLSNLLPLTFKMPNSSSEQRISSNNEESTQRDTSILPNEGGVGEVPARRVPREKALKSKTKRVEKEKKTIPFNRYFGKAGGLSSKYYSHYAPIEPSFKVVKKFAPLPRPTSKVSSSNPRITEERKEASEESRRDQNSIIPTPKKFTPIPLRQGESEAQSSTTELMERIAEMTKSASKKKEDSPLLQNSLTQEREKIISLGGVDKEYVEMIRKQTRINVEEMHQDLLDSEEMKLFSFPATKLSSYTIDRNGVLHITEDSRGKEQLERDYLSSHFESSIRQDIHELSSATPRTEEVNRGFIEDSEESSPYFRQDRMRGDVNELRIGEEKKKDRSEEGIKISIDEGHSEEANNSDSERCLIPERQRQEKHPACDDETSVIQKESYHDSEPLQLDLAPSSEQIPEQFTDSEEEKRQSPCDKQRSAELHIPLNNTPPSNYLPDPSAEISPLSHFSLNRPELPEKEPCFSEGESLQEERIVFSRMQAQEDPSLSPMTGTPVRPMTQDSLPERPSPLTFPDDEVTHLSIELENLPSLPSLHRESVFIATPNNTTPLEESCDKAYSPCTSARVSRSSQNLLERTPVPKDESIRSPLPPDSLEGTSSVEFYGKAPIARIPSSLSRESLDKQHSPHGTLRKESSHRESDENEIHSLVGVEKPTTRHESSEREFAPLNFFERVSTPSDSLQKTPSVHRSIPSRTMSHASLSQKLSSPFSKTRKSSQLPSFERESSLLEKMKQRTRDPIDNMLEGLFHSIETTAAITRHTARFSDLLNPLLSSLSTTDKHSLLSSEIFNYASYLSLTTEKRPTLHGVASGKSLLTHLLLERDPVTSSRGNNSLDTSNLVLDYPLMKFATRESARREILASLRGDSQRGRYSLDLVALNEPVKADNCSLFSDQLLYDIATEWEEDYEKRSEKQKKGDENWRRKVKEEVGELSLSEDAFARKVRLALVLASELYVIQYYDDAYVKVIKNVVMENLGLASSHFSHCDYVDSMLYAVFASYAEIPFLVDGENIHSIIFTETK